MKTSIRSIEIFVRAVESGSFVAAARSLLIDPAAVSRSIKGLEEQLGIALFTRSTRRLQLTAAGARFYRDGVQLLKKFDDTIHKFRTDTVMHGQIRVGMGPALARRMLSRAMPSFQKLYPDVRLILFSINDPAEIGDEGIDVFLRPRSMRQRGGEHKLPQGLVVRKLMYSPLVACASPAYMQRKGIPHMPSDLAQHDCTALLTLERDVQGNLRKRTSAKRSGLRRR
jgi:DNA-binding transcriptional LysR family regulator